MLAHEVAHADTHLAADIDGDRWKSDHFAKTDHALKEGLAQYYTYRVCLRLQNQFPYAIGAYKELLKHQPQAYKTQELWIKNHLPEEVRLAMLETRRKGAGKIRDFESSLNSARSTLRKPKP